MGRGRRYTWQVCSTWELSLITREGKRGASDCLISGSSVSKPKARLRASKSGKLRAEGEGKDNIWPRDRLILAPISAVARFSNDWRSGRDWRIPWKRVSTDYESSNFVHFFFSSLWYINICFMPIDGDLLSLKSNQLTFFGKWVIGCIFLLVNFIDHNKLANKLWIYTRRGRGRDAAKGKDSLLSFLHREIRDGYIIPLREGNFNGKLFVE